LQRLSENEAHEREKLGLRLENVLFRSEHILPPGNVNEHQRKIGSNGIPSMQMHVCMDDDSEIIGSA
jgi:hypothetical protein